MLEEVAGKAEACLQVAGQLWLRCSCCKGSTDAPCTYAFPAYSSRCTHSRQQCICAICKIKMHKHGMRTKL